MTTPMRYGLLLPNDHQVTIPIHPKLLESGRAEGLTKVSLSDTTLATVTTDGKSITIDPHRDGLLRVQLIGRNGRPLGYPLDVDIVDNFEGSFEVTAAVFAPKTPDEPHVERRDPASAGVRPDGKPERRGVPERRVAMGAPPAGTPERRIA